MKGGAACFLILGGFAGASACGGHETGDGAGGHGGHAGVTTTATTTAASAPGSTGAGSGGPPQAPVMKSVVPMEGALHVSWDNTTPDCESIELDRNHDGGAFETAYTLVGAADSQHDTSAVPPGQYCYKARCIKGTETSPDSAEKCGTP